MSHYLNSKLVTNVYQILFLGPIFPVLCIVYMYVSRSAATAILEHRLNLFIESSFSQVMTPVFA